MGLSTDAAGNLYALASTSSAPTAMSPLVKMAPDGSMITITQTLVGNQYIADQYGNRIAEVDTSKMNGAGPNGGCGQ